MNLTDLMAFNARLKELNRQPKDTLISLVKNRGFIGSAHPLETWTKRELIVFVMEAEFPERFSPPDTPKEES